MTPQEMNQKAMALSLEAAKSKDPAKYSEATQEVFVMLDQEISKLQGIHGAPSQASNVEQRCFTRESSFHNAASPITAAAMIAVASHPTTCSWPFSSTK